MWQPPAHVLWCLQDQMNSVARFLEGRGRTADALEVATDPDYRFELAVQLSKLDVALEIAESADSEGKWRQLSELAMSSGRLQVRFSSLLHQQSLHLVLQQQPHASLLPR